MFFCSNMLINASIIRKTHLQSIAHADIATAPISVLVQKIADLGFDISAITQMKSEARLREWLSIRFLTYEIFGKASEIKYSTSGKPFLQNEKAHVSFSHSKNKIAIALDFEKPTGIDIQKISSKLQAIKHKFLHPAEVHRRKTYSTEELSVFWSAKEAIYKVYGHPEIFLRDIRIDEFIFNGKGSSVKGYLQLDGKEHVFFIKYEQIEDYLLAYAANP